MTMILDTRGMSEVKSFTMIVDDGTPEGEKLDFTIKPLTSDSYLKMVENQAKLQSLKDKGVTAKTLSAAQKVMDDIVTPLIEPADVFHDWAETAGGFAYRAVMDRVTALAIPKVEKD